MNAPSNVFTPDLLAQAPLVAFWGPVWVRARARAPCVRFKTTVKHEKHSLQSLRARAATPCDAVLSMGYKYILLSSEGPQRYRALIPSTRKYEYP